MLVPLIDQHQFQFAHTTDHFLSVGSPLPRLATAHIRLRIDPLSTPEMELLPARFQSIAHPVTSGCSGYQGSFILFSLSSSVYCRSSGGARIVGRSKKGRNRRIHLHCCVHLAPSRYSAEQVTVQCTQRSGNTGAPLWPRLPPPSINSSTHVPSTDKFIAVAAE